MPGDNRMKYNDLQSLGSPKGQNTSIKTHHSPWHSLYCQDTGITKAKHNQDVAAGNSSPPETRRTQSTCRQCGYLGNFEDCQ